MGNPPNNSQMEAIRSSLFERNKIGAIQSYREATGLSLTESKAAVEKLEFELRTTSPAAFKHQAKRGCVGMLVMFCGLVILLTLVAT